MHFSTFSCWIQVDGTPLPEYQVQDSPDGAGVRCWIPSEVGKAFQICCSDSERALTTGSVAIVDGQKCGGNILYSKSDRPRSKYSFTTQKGAVISETSYRPFVFSNCQLVDDDNLLDRPSEIGQIKVVIHEIRIHGREPPRNIALAPLQMHERAKKGIVHGIRLGNEVVEKQNPTKKSSSLRKIATFTFNYRPMGVLVAEGIAPRSEDVRVTTKVMPMPSSNVVDLTLNDDSDKEASCSQKGRIDIELVKQERPDDVVIDLTV
ncbi:hypothetical protein CPB84DRAFT_1222884 [Gymnopilus junonius]|uniref:DUF7918 domain-containing protein n=1 Tax=Gymnopilus junonius TaxID=109634 RepID=A0A9P5NYB2_GYMJU|nr:hypothetical protein CPB84DRAFT_1222884 [Gymnopilus junonius]